MKIDKNNQDSIRRPWDQESGALAFTPSYHYDFCIGKLSVSYIYFIMFMTWCHRICRCLKLMQISNNPPNAEDRLTEQKQYAQWSLIPVHKREDVFLQQYGHFGNILRLLNKYSDTYVHLCFVCQFTEHACWYVTR